jgi:hypothetical protein
MRSLFLNTDLAYSGDAILAHWALKQHHVQGDSVIAFIGPCEVRLDKMVDLCDVASGAFIYSPRMVHFIIEHFDLDLEKAVWQQRLLVAMIQEEVQQRAGRLCLKRDGNDLYDKDKKLNVSIAAPTGVSVKIHVGVNVQTLGTPVKTAGLEDYGIDEKAFAQSVMQRYVQECEDVLLDRSKVRLAV